MFAERLWLRDSTPAWAFRGGASPANDRRHRAHGGYGRPPSGGGRGVLALERPRVLSGSCEILEEPFSTSVCLGGGEFC